ncbi:MAG: hypothetical protein JNL21_14740 [Myxococcales bacterium]|nr:hypothetical protein [Myxococcales bacterium]
MGDDDEDLQAASKTARAIKVVLFVASAALFAGLVKLSFRVPLVAALVAAAVAAVLLWRWWSRARVVRMLRRGEVHEVIAHWSDGLDQAPHADTITPLVTATAFAAFGRVDDARRALASAARGPAWEAAIEHRIFLDALLSTFEGDADHAREQVARLVTLPMPGRRDVAERVGALREAVAALVRAFSHRALPGDLVRLEQASENSPLVHWAMRYAAAIVAIDAGDQIKARELIANAPPWPAESAFRSFHDEIRAAC